MVGNRINIIVTSTSGIKYRFAKKDKTTIGQDVELKAARTVITIPNEAAYLYIYASGKVINEVEVNTEPRYTNVEVYPTITQGKVEEGYNTVEIMYNTSAIIREYSYDNENWMRYDEKPKKLKIGNIIYARQQDKDNKIGEVSTYESTISDMLRKEAYDEDETTYDNAGNNTRRIDINPIVRGKLLNIKESGTGNITVNFYNASGEIISTDTRVGTLREVSYIIPNNASYVTISGSNLKVYEISIGELPNLIANPRIIVSDEGKYTYKKTVTIYYAGNQYTNEYSLDKGQSWNTYNGAFEIDHYATIYARSLDNGKYISGSTYDVSKLASTLNYVTNDSSIVLEPKVVLYGTQYGELPVLDNNEDYMFAGWYLDAGYTMEVTADTIVSNHLDHNIYARWVSLATNFGSTNSEKAYVAPFTGNYKLEVWGAQGGSHGTFNGNSVGCPSRTGGYGGYATGTVYLTKGTTLYVNVGGNGSCVKAQGHYGYNAGGYNGGGGGYNYQVPYRCSGGGATHIALSSGLLSTLSEKREDILIVAGGGSGSYACSASTFSCNCNPNGYAGGGYIGVAGNSAYAGTQTSGYAFGTSNGRYTTSAAYAGGGGGFYGGKPASSAGAGGGSGYIGNSLLISTDSLTKHMTCYGCATSNEESIRTIKTGSVSSSPVTDYAKSGAGYAKITYLDY